MCTNRLLTKKKTRASCSRKTIRTAQTELIKLRVFVCILEIFHKWTRIPIFLTAQRQPTANEMSVVSLVLFAVFFEFNPNECTEFTRNHWNFFLLFFFRALICSIKTRKDCLQWKLCDSKEFVAGKRHGRLYNLTCVYNNIWSQWKWCADIGSLCPFSQHLIRQPDCNYYFCPLIMTIFMMLKISFLHFIWNCLLQRKIRFQTKEKCGLWVVNVVWKTWICK